MRRPAAGGAGGRPAAIGPVRPGRALLRAALVPLLAATVGVLAPTASAAPGDPGLAAAPADDDASEPERPLRIDVSRFEPRTVTPGSVVSVTGTLTNTGTTPITDLTIRLQRGELVQNREQLAGLDDRPDPATTVEPSFAEVQRSTDPADVITSIAPGDDTTFTYTLDSTALGLDRDGVYPVLLNVNGTVDGDTRRVGELSTFVVQQPLVPTARTAVAWLWPLTERTHRTASGTFVDDALAESIGEGGRLDRALAVVERLPNTTPALQVTLAIDPALVEEIQDMEDGYDVPGGQGTGVDAAGKYLERLRNVAAAHPVVALPYGDVDVDALDAANLSEVVTRSLPGTPLGTAQDPPGAPAEASGTPLPPAEGSDAPADGAPAFEDGAGARILAEALEVEPQTDLAWAPGGTIRPESLDVLRQGGIDRVVLGTDGLTTGESAAGLGDPTAAAATTVDTPGGAVDVLVADTRLTDVVANSEHMAGGARMAEQRYLAELAVLTGQVPEGSEQTVLVTAPRDVDAGPDGAGAMMSVTTSLPWLRPVGLADLAAARSTDDPGELVEPVDAVRLDAAGLAGLTDVVASRDDLAGAVEGDAGTALQAFDAAVARGTSVAWRTEPVFFRASAADLAATMQRLRSQVTLLAPADGTYTLASSDAPLVLTVRNDLPFAVRVLLDVGARGNRGLTIGDIGQQVLAPGSRATLQVPASLRQSGTFVVAATLTTPGGEDLGESVRMQVRSGAYGPISLIITIGAASLLGLLFLRRLVHFVLRRRARARQGGAPAAGAGHPSGTRSPV